MCALVDELFMCARLVMACEEQEIRDFLRTQCKQMDHTHKMIQTYFSPGQDAGKVEGREILEGDNTPMG